MAGPEVVVVDDSDEEVEEPGPPLNARLKQEGDTDLEARMHKALREVFRLRAFRPPQQAVVKHVLKGGSGLVLVSCVILWVDPKASFIPRVPAAERWIDAPHTHHRPSPVPPSHHVTASYGWG